MSKQVELNLEELKPFLKHFITTNQALQKANKFPVTIEVEGESGIGKTSGIKQLAEEIKWDFKKVNLAQLDELGDIIGFPTRRFQVTKNEGSEDNPKWNTKWADEAILQQYIEKGYEPTGKDKMGYSLPEWVPTHDKGCIVLFDDYTRAQQRFLQALMEILDRQEYISWKMPQNCTIILSANPDNGEYQVQSQDSAQKTRYVSVNLKFDKDVWARWAESEGIDGRCINFLLMHPELVTRETNARAITTFFNSISTFKIFEENLPMIQMIGEGSVGPEFSTMFTQFINNKLDKLISPEIMLLDKDEEKVMRALKGAIGVDQNYRADIASVLCTRFTNFTLIHAEDNPIDKVKAERITKLMIDNAFGNDLKYFTIRELIGKNKKKFQLLMTNQEIVDIALK